MTSPTARLARHLAGMALASVLLSAAAPSGAAGIGAFEGSWSATAVESEPPLEIDPGGLGLEIRASSDGGFTARWSNPPLPGTTGAPDAIEARFAPTDNPEVFALRTPRTSLLRQLLASPTTGNPLKGDTLIWARMLDDALILYSLSIDRHGAPVLVRSTHVPEGRSLRLERTVRVGTRQPVEIQAELTRSGS